MNVFVLGATGFVGRAAAAALRAHGHAVLGSSIRFERALRPDDWLDAVRGIDAVVNAVGIFRERGAQTFGALHDAAPRALFEACEKAGVQRVVQVSALGADQGAGSAFHLSKKRADDFLAARALQWSIVQPSLVFGEGGASARFFTLLACLPATSSASSFSWSSNRGFSRSANAKPAAREAYTMTTDVADRCDVIVHQAS